MDKESINLPPFYVGYAHNFEQITL